MSDFTFYAQTFASNLIIGFAIYILLIVAIGLYNDYKSQIVIFFKYIYYLLTGVN